MPKRIDCRRDAAGGGRVKQIEVFKARVRTASPCVAEDGQAKMLRLALHLLDLLGCHLHYLELLCAFGAL